MAGTSGDLTFLATIAFDKEGAIVSDMSKILKNLQLFADGKPIVEKINFDTSGFKHFEESFKRSNETIREMRKTLEQAFATIPNKDKFSDTNFTKLTDSARQLLDVINQLKVAEETYAKSASQILKERQRSIDAEIKANDRKTASVRAGVIDTQKQIDSVNMLTHQYERLVPILNAIAQKRVNVKVDIDKAYQVDLDRINREIDRLRRLNLTLGAKGDVSAIKANLDTIRLLEEEIKKINKTKIDLFNMDKVQSDFARIQSLTAQTFGELQNATRKLGADNSLNAALEAQSQKVLQLHERIKALDAEIARMNATGRLYDSSGGFTTEATAKLQERMALTKRLTQESISGQQAQIQYERQLQAEKRRTEQQAKEATREAARIAKEEANARKRAQDAANAENKARQASYNARKQQGLEIQRILKAEENSIDAITKKLQVQQQRLSTTTFGSAKFDKIIAEVDRLTKKLQEAQNKINELTGKTVSGANQQAAAVKKVNTEMQKQHSYLENLIRRMTVYASIGAVGGFLTQVREVTAQFELQRVSLGAIIQDQNKANALFSEIKNFALKSPLKILDLTKYTKQLAAYRIETDKLFDTTKRLADVSVGLGVDMQRIILAYGQVKAASYLRAAEVRQFTEAGIPLLELLADKFTKLNGQMVTTEQVMDMISKRGVGFNMVAEIFEDMTNKGGIFYNMQEKQGNTLYGMWAKLGDAASVMYNNIGNTEGVNKAMKGTINLLRSIMLAWRDVGRALLTAGAAFIAFKANSLFLNTFRNKTTAATVATDNLAKSHVRLNQAMSSGNRMLIASERLYHKAAQASLAATRANGFWATSMLKLRATFLSLRAALVGLTPMLAFTAIFAGWQMIESYIEKVNRLKNALSEIQQSSIAEQSKSVRNFESLVDRAVSSPEGSKEQRDALEELHTTYSKIIPVEDLQIDKLRAMKGNYEMLTQAIRENIEEQKRQEGITTIIDEYATKIKENEDKLKEALGEGFIIDDSIVQFGEEQIDRILENYSTYIKEHGKFDGGFISQESVNEALAAALKLEGVYIKTNASFRELQKMTQSQIGAFYNLGTTIVKQEKELKKWDNQMKNTFPTLGKLAELMEEAQRKVEEHQYASVKGEFTFDQETTQATVEAYLEALNTAFEQAGVQIDLSKFITYGENNEIAWIDYDKLNEEIGKYNVIVDEEHQRLLALKEAYNNQLAAETAKGKDANIQIIEEYQAKIREINGKLENFVDIPSLQNMVKNVQEIFRGFIPADPVVARLQNKLKEISTSIWNNLNKGMESMRKYAWDGTTLLHKQYKDWKDQLELLEADIYKYRQLMMSAGMTKEALKRLFGIDLDNMEKEAQGLRDLMKEAATYIPSSLMPKETKTKTKKEKAVTAPKQSRPSTSTKPEDTTKQDLLEVLRVLEEIQKKYEELEKVEGPAKAAEHTKEAFKDSFAKAQALYKKHGGTKLFEWPLTVEALIEDIGYLIPVMATRTKTLVKQTEAYAAHLRKETEAKNRDDIKTLNKLRMSRPTQYKLEKVSVNTDKDVLDLMRKQSDLQLDSLRKYLQNRLKELATEISQTKEAKDFYEKILSQTGDMQLAANVTMTIYGETGDGLNQLFREQIESLFAGAGIEMPENIVFTSGSINYKALEEQVEELKDILGKDTYEALKKIAKDGRKDWAKAFEGYLKDIEKAKSYSQQRIELARTTANEINQIRSGEKGAYDDKTQEYLIQGLLDKAQKEAAKQEWEAFKDTPMYVQMFDDLEYASTGALESMQRMLLSLKNVWGESLDPQNLKEMQSRLNDISEQLARRNPFKGIKEGIQEIRKLNKDYGSQSKLSKDLAQATNELVNAKQKLDNALKEEARYTEDVKNAQESFDTVKGQLEALNKEFDDIEREEGIDWFKTTPEGQEWIETFETVIDRYEEAKKKLEEAQTKVNVRAELNKFSPEEIKEAQEAYERYLYLLERVNEQEDEILAKNNPTEQYFALLDEEDSVESKAQANNATIQWLTDKYGDIWELLKQINGEEYTSVKLAQKEVDLAEQKVKKFGKANEEYNEGKKKIGEGTKALREYVDQITEAIGAIRECVEEWSALGDDEMWQSIWEGIDKLNESAGNAADAAQAYMSGDYFTAITKSITAVAQLISAIGKLYYGPKIAKANKEIERQEKILSQLEYTYDRLGKAQERLFGGEYIQNYNQQIANLYAQAEAYRKQAEAERSKGKKADKDAIQDYVDSWRDTMDEIKDMQDDLKEYLLGTDLTSAARDWANSWLEARWAFEDTTEAMKENFADMVQNMIVESMAAKLMESVLRPVYDAIDEATADQQITADEIARIAELGYNAIEQANIGMEGLMAQLQAAGLNLQEMFGEESELTGISRDIATASEESINGLAQGINTQNYYIAFVSENVAAIRALMEGGAGVNVGSGVDLVGLQNEHLSQLPMIEANTRATAERCERAAIACEAIQSSLERVIDVRGNKQVVNTTMY